MSKLVGLLICLFIVVGCMDKSDPESVLKSFISLRFEGLSAKDKAIGLTTGDLKETLLGLDEEKAKKFWEMDKQSKKKIKINIKNCQEKEGVCYLTYTLSYNQKSDSPESNYNIETKKIAKLEKEEDKWLISDVSEVKTFIDSKVELK